MWGNGNRATGQTAAGAESNYDCGGRADPIGKSERSIVTGRKEIRVGHHSPWQLGMTTPPLTHKQ